MTTQNNIIDLSLIRFPAGSKAWHPQYRICYVVKANGSQRSIRWVRHGSNEFKWDYADVDVNELKTVAC